LSTWRCVRNTKSCFDRSPHLTNVPEAFNYSPRITTSLQTDTRSRCRLYIDRAKDWVEWTLGQPPRVKNSVLPRYAGSNNEIKAKYINCQKLLLHKTHIFRKHRQFIIKILQNFFYKCVRNWLDYHLTEKFQKNEKLPETSKVAKNFKSCRKL
jgi:hypothetical protein